MLKNMSGTKSKQDIPTIREGNISYITNVEKAEAFARNFAKNSSHHNFETVFLKNKKTKKIENKPNPSHQFHAINDRFEIHEIQTAIRQCKSNSSPGEDEICYEMLKHLPKSSIFVLQTMFNQIWENGILPTSWTHSIVLPIRKQMQDPSLLDSHRPIALTNAMCKINERLIATRLNWFMERNKLFNPNQSGFRKNRRCLDQLMRLQSNIKDSLNHKLHTVGIFQDFSKAFDMLWTEVLLHKMIKLNIGGNMFEWIKNFVTNRTFQVKIGNSLSNSHELENGTPQGSVISPILFLIMINDLPTMTRGVQQAVFADDTAMWNNGKNLQDIIHDVQKNLDDVRKWCLQWGFILSKEKTVAVIFSRCDKQTDFKLSIDEVEIKWSKQIKFLGLIFDDTLTWNAHVNYVVDRCKPRLNLMRCISGTSWDADKKSLLHIYQALIRSIIDYGCEAYHSASPSILAKIDRVQSYALRICCGAMKCSSIAALQVECGEKPLELRRESFQLKYAIKIKSIEDHPASAILKDRKIIKRNKQSFAKRTKPFLMEIKTQVEGPNIPILPPWHNTKPDVNTKLQTLLNKRMSSEIVSNVVSQFILKYDDCIKCFTDGSITAEGDAGAGYYIPSFNIKQSFALSKQISIFTAELIAVRETLKYIDTKPDIEKYVILSDSLGVIASVKSGLSLNRPNLINEIRNIITKVTRDNKKITFVWLPSHINVEGVIILRFADSGKCAGRRSPVAGRRSPVAGRRSPVADRRSPVAGHLPRRWARCIELMLRPTTWSIVLLLA